MKKQIASILTYLAAFVLILSSCKKDNTPAAKTKTDLITQGSWKFSSATVGGSDVSAFLQSCQKDNIVTFAAAGTGTVDEGPTKCNSSDPQTSSFTWNFANNETVLHVSTTFFAGGSNDSNLVTLTETQLVVSQNVTISGSSQTAIVTFIH